MYGYCYANDLQPPIEMAKKNVYMFQTILRIKTFFVTNNFLSTFFLTAIKKIILKDVQCSETDFLVQRIFPVFETWSILHSTIVSNELGST